MHNVYIYIVLGVVQNLICTQSSSLELSLSWGQSILLGDEVIGYQVTVSRLQHRPGTRDVTQFTVHDHFTEMKRASVNGLGKFNCASFSS